MDHIVYVDAKAKAMELLISKEKRMIIRGAAGRITPYGRVEIGNTLFFINNNAEGLVKAKGVVSEVFNSQKMIKEESAKLVRENQEKLRLSKSQLNKFAGKKYIILITVDNVERMEPFGIDKTDYGKMDNWLCVEDIERVKLN